MRWCVMLTALVLAAGCAPRSVDPLLRVGEQAMRDEIDRLEAETERDARWIKQSRAMLEQGYALDLEERETLDRDWVMQATRGYVAAREELTRHELALEQERRQRAENLTAGAEAVQRARDLLQHRDELWGELPVWRRLKKGE